MKVVNIQAAKTHLSRLLEEAAAGEEIVLAKAGKPYVKLVPCGPGTTNRVLGGWEGKVEIGGDFDAFDPRIAQLFDGAGSPSRPRRAASRSRAKRP